MKVEMKTRLRPPHGSQSDWQRYHPLALDAWTPVYHTEVGTFMPDASQQHPDARRFLSSSVDQAQRVALKEVSSLEDGNLREFAAQAILHLTTNQANRNSRYFNNSTKAWLEEAYPDQEERYAIQYGDASQAELARVVRDHDDKITSLELARHTHIGAWQRGDDINTYVRTQLLEDTGLDVMEKKGNPPRHKIKMFGEGVALAERKRAVMCVGARVLTVMRFSYLIDRTHPDTPESLQELIQEEYSYFKQRQREDGEYNFDKENELLSSLVDSHVRNRDFREKPKYIIPLQTGYYAYSEEAHQREKMLEAENTK